MVTIKMNLVKKRLLSLILISGLVASNFIILITFLDNEKVNASFVGPDATPPGSGDWIINTPGNVVTSETIVLNGNLEINNGGSLTFKNVKLKMNCATNGTYHIYVMSGGSFYIYDLDNDPTTTNDASIITSNNPDGNHRFYFRVMTFASTTTFKMKNSELHECGYGQFDAMRKGLSIEIPNTIIENSLFSNNLIGIRVSGNRNTIRNCTFLDNSNGVQIYSRDNKIINSTFSNKGSGVYISGQWGRYNKIIDCNMTNNSNGIRFYLNANNNLISNCTVFKNRNYGIVFTNNVLSNIIENCIISFNELSGISFYNSFADQEGCNNNIINNSKILNNYKHGIYFLNNQNKITKYNNITNCNISYNKNNGIRFSSPCNNNISNCNIFLNNWSGISTSYSSFNNITNCTISKNNDTGINLTFNSLGNLIKWNFIHNNYNGIYFKSNSNATVHYNEIHNNTNYGVNNTDSSVIVNATYNWWGHPSGPYDPSDDTATGGLYNPSGLGNNVSDYVIYSIWLLKPGNIDPTIDTIDNIFAVEDTYYVTKYTASDLNGHSIEWKYNSNATWLNWSATNKSLYGTPTNSDVGTCWVCLNITDGWGGYDEHNFTLTVTNVNPDIISSNIVTAIEDILYYNDYDSDDDEQGYVTWRLATNSTWLDIDSHVGILNGIPDNDDVGWCWVNVTVDDGNSGIDFRNFTLMVLNTNDAPTIDTIDIPTINEDEYYEVSYFATEIDIGDILTWTYESNATWLDWGSDNHTLYGTPSNDNVGWYWVRINVSDGNDGYDGHYFTLTVINTNDAPTIDTQDLLTVYEDEYYEVIYTATDIDIGDILEWTQSTNATWLYWGPENHTLYGTPRNDDVGEYWVKIITTDRNQECDEHYFTFNVISVNDAPIITSAPTTFEVDAFENKTLDLSAYIYDVDNDLSELILNVDSKHAQVNWLSITFNYPNSVSLENVEITVSDGIDISDPHYILVTVIPKDIDPPTIIEKTPTGTNISVNTNITITFSEFMLLSAVEDAFYIFPKIKGEFNWNGTMMIFNPASNLSHNIQYTITINSTATDLAGNSIGDTYSWNFTTVELDTDGDGIPDDEDDDDDNDSFLDTCEEFLGTDPKDPQERPIDTDGDRKPDGDKNNSKSWMDLDDDNDGFTDEEELKAHTNPLDKDDYPVKKKEKQGDYTIYIILILVILIIILILVVMILKRKKDGKKGAILEKEEEEKKGIELESEIDKNLDRF